MLKQWVGIGTISLLTACGNSDISAIKDSSLYDYPNFTIGQAFDNRKLCSSTEWTSFTDDRERTIVEYRCHLNGVTEYYKDVIDRSLEATKKSNAFNIKSNQENNQERSSKLATLETALAEAQAELDAHLANLPAFTDKQWADFKALEDLRDKAKISDIFAYYRDEVDFPVKLWPGDYAKDTPYDDMARFMESFRNNYPTLDKARKADAGRLKDFDEIKSRLIPELDRQLSRYKLATESAISYYSHSQKSKLGNIESDIKRIKEAQSDAQGRLTNLSKQLQRIEAAAANNEAEKIEAYEYYHWVINDDAVQVINGGIVEITAEGEHQDFSYGSALPIKLVYDNSIAEFKDYLYLAYFARWGAGAGKLYEKL